MNYHEIISAITNSITATIEQMLQKANVDRSYKMIVIEKISDKKYKVQYKKSLYTAIGYRTNISVGDYVMVTAPCGNWNELFIV